MELVLLPLLLLAGLLTTLGGNDGDDSPDPEPDPHDTLSGDGTDRIFGGEGDDLLTLKDQATGLGGAGDDTIHAEDAAVGHGREGEDSLTATDNATVMGGAGDDWLNAEDEALAGGGDGDDVLFLSGNTHGHGGDGDDTLNARDEANAYGGDGDDQLQGRDDASLFGGAGNDTFLIDHRDAHAGAAYDSVIVSVEDMQDGDRIALLLGTRDTSNLTFYTTPFTPDDNYTLVTMRETMADGAVRATSFQLQGVRDFDLTDLVLYGNEVGDVIDWQGVDGNDTLSGDGNDLVYGGQGDDEITLSDTAFGQGGAGNDLIFAEDSTRAYGSEGNDTLIAEGGRPTLSGGTGDDLFALDWSTPAQDYATTVVTDFNPSQDQLALIIGNRDIVALRATVTQDPDTSDAIVRFVAGGNVPDPDAPPVAVLRLQGVSASEVDLNDVVLFGTDLSDPLDWAPDPAWTETIRGSADADTITLNDSQVGFGEGGNDTLIASDEALAYGGAGADSLRGNDSATLQGGEGNDSLTAIFAAEAYGEAGDDVMLSFGNPQYYVQPSLYGGDGHDTLSGDGDLYGGAGNDLIEPDADGSLFNGVDSYSGAVYGGDGDDTIRGDDPHGGLWGGLTFYGGAGNDLIASDEGGGIDAGAGNDIVLTRLHDAVESADILMTDGEVHSNYARTTLGAGSDVLALDLLSVSNPSPDWPFDGSHVIADFNPDHDELALILPSADVGAFTASLVPHAPTGFMQLRLENETASMTILLEGVTSAFPIGEINIYADEAAVLARTPYATL